MESFSNYQSSVGQDSQNPFQSVLSRAEVGASAGMLYEYTQLTGYVTYQPYIGVIAAWIPRELWPDKPVPGTADGTYQTEVGRLLATLYGMGDIAEGASMTSPAAGVMYWQFGWLGVLGGGLMIGLLWRILSEILLSQGSYLGMLLFVWMVPSFITPGDSLNVVLLLIIRYVLPVWLFNRIFTPRTQTMVVNQESPVILKAL
jgi:hypothetical protein